VVGNLQPTKQNNTACSAFTKCIAVWPT